MSGLPTRLPALGRFLIGSALLLALPARDAAAIVIVETFDPGPGQGEFTVTNDQLVDLYAFFVGNNEAIQADRAGDGNPNPVLDSWNARVVQRSEWESNSFLDRVGRDGWTPPDTSTLDWDSLFGAEFNQILAYWADGFLELPQVPITPGQTQGGFVFYSPVANSPFVGLGVAGTVIASGETSLVPEPGAALLIVAPLLAFALRRR